MNENKMGVMPMTKLIISMSLPMMLSMLVQALYNIVDSMWVSRVSQDALTAVSLAFPVQNLMLAFASGTGVGVNALISRALGAGNRERANNVAVHGLILAMGNAFLFTLFGIFGVKWFFAGQVDPASRTFAYSVDYLSVVCIVSYGIFGQVMSERLMQSTGRTTLSMATQLTGAVINIILDPLLILGVGPFPRLETRGAAIATVIGQCTAFVLGVILNKTKNKDLEITLRGFRFHGGIVKDIYFIGVPSIIMIAIGSVMTYFLNKILIAFTEAAVAVFGVYFKLQSFFFMPVFGLNNGIIPIVAYNYGARRRLRMLSAVKRSLFFATTLMGLGTIIMWLFPKQLLLIFKATDEMLAIGVPALRTISVSFIIAAVCISLGSVFQALGVSYYSMIVSFCRQLIVLLPCAFFLAKTGNVAMVWFAFPMAELASLAVTLICYSRVKKRIINKVEIEEASS